MKRGTMPKSLKSGGGHMPPAPGSYIHVSRAVVVRLFTKRFTVTIGHEKNYCYLHREGILQYIPCLMNGTIFDSPFFVVDGIARIGFPRPSLHKAAPRKKSICPPTPAEITKK